MVRSSVAEATGAGQSDVRTSSTGWLPSTTPIGDAIERRAAQLTQADRSLFEAMQVVHYDGPQKYHSHYDYFPKENFPNEDGAPFQVDDRGLFVVLLASLTLSALQLGEQRLATLFFYLNTVPEGQGGETVFPRAGDNDPYPPHGYVDYKDCKRGLRVRPVKGDAVL